MQKYLTKLSVILLTLLLVAATPVLAVDFFRNLGLSSGVKGSGDLVTETRDLKPFQRIEMIGSCDIHVTIGPQQKVVVTFDDNLIDLIETQVAGKTLEIGSRKSYSSDHACRIEITVPDLKTVYSKGSGDFLIENLNTEHFIFKLSGSGDITIQNLKADVFEFKLSGSGDLSVDGDVRELEIQLSGSGDIDARDLVAEEVYVKVSGSGMVRVFAKEEFEGRVSGSGTIAYYGDPEHISTRVTGSGRIRKR